MLPTQALIFMVFVCDNSKIVPLFLLLCTLLSSFHWLHLYFNHNSTLFRCMLVLLGFLCALSGLSIAWLLCLVLSLFDFSLLLSAAVLCPYKCSIVCFVDAPFVGYNSRLRGLMSKQPDVKDAGMCVSWSVFGFVSTSVCSVLFCSCVVEVCVLEY